LFIKGIFVDKTPTTNGVGEQTKSINFVGRMGIRTCYFLKKKKLKKN